ncbi:MAG: hypothetical protein MZV64_41705 [Ignavibacteriales bacterium]|nr:hypothetical protein [Ignavibacteriales bacterium]
MMNKEQGIMNNEINKNKKFDLEERLIEFAILIIEITENLYNTRAGNHVAGQLVGSGTSHLLFFMGKHKVQNP